MRALGGLSASVLVLGIGMGILGCAEEAKLNIHNPWIEAAAATQTSTGAYMAIQNLTTQAKVLVAASSDRAVAVALSAMPMGGDDETEPLTVDQIPIPAMGRVDLTPTGHHLRFHELRRDFQEGETVHLTLYFQDGSSKEVKAVVRKPKQEE